MNKKSIYEDYCTACGLCIEEAKVEFEEKAGFDYPKLKTINQIQFCEKVCPVNAINFKRADEISLWGKYEGAYRAWSTDDTVRYKAASGGVTTSICVYLLKTQKIDYVLQIGEKNDDPLGIKLYCNDSPEKVKEYCASRYISGISYGDIHRYINADKKYAIVGKPCDIEAITNFLEIHPSLKKSIKYRLTFFCAGAPGRNANRRLFSELGVKEGAVKTVRYRGNGWPGLATVATKEKEYTMPYIDSWNGILGRDIRKICKFCINGIGEVADISCGDLWYLNNEKKPIFEEKNGQNIVFARTTVGLKLLENAYTDGFIHLENYTDFSDFRYIQPNHAMKRSTMYGKIIGLKLLFRDVPLYDCKKLRQLAKDTNRLKIMKTVLGTIKRVMKGSL